MKLLAFVFLSGGSFKLNISTHITSVKFLVHFNFIPFVFSFFFFWGGGGGGGGVRGGII